MKADGKSGNAPSKVAVQSNNQTVKNAVLDKNHCALQWFFAFKAVYAAGFAPAHWSLNETIRFDVLTLCPSFKIVARQPAV
jgi:hypothetical protein